MPPTPVDIIWHRGFFLPEIFLYKNEQVSIPELYQNIGVITIVEFGLYDDPTIP